MLEIHPIKGGFVKLIDVMGSDTSIVEAARISYGDGTRTVTKDRGLIRYLMRNNHTTPFEMVEMKFHIRIPMDCWRQFVRHRTFNVNEYSTRYSIAINETQKTDPSDWRVQSKKNKQGSGDFFEEKEGRIMSEQENNLHEISRDIYEDRIKKGVSREQARKDLPLATFTEVIVKNDLHNLLHFLKLRLDKHAQLEIRLYAQAIADMVKKTFPITWQAFEDYKLNSVTFTHAELHALFAYLREDNEYSFGWDNKEAFFKQLDTEDRTEYNRLLETLSKRERQEFYEKIVDFL